MLVSLEGAASEGNISIYDCSTGLGKLQQAWNFFNTILFSDFSATFLTPYGLGSILYLAGPFLLLEIWLARRNDLLALTTVPWGWRSAAYAYALFMLVVHQPLRTSEFIYFQF